MISNLIYVSVRKQICTDEEIAKILASCQKNNKDVDVTGVLLYSEKKFIQYLEGEYKTIYSLYDKIKSDPRHTNVILVATSNIQKRLFPSWQMGAKKIDDSVEFIGFLKDDEKQLFEKILVGKEAPGNRAVRLIQRFFLN